MERLWTAKKIVQAQVHPDTGEIIPPPFRMSGFVPFGTPIVVGVLLAGSSPYQNIFWQWMNQSHNAAVNYFNRNATASTTNKDALLSYAAAVTTAVSVSVAMGKVTQKIDAPVLTRFVPFVAVATANIANIVMMRRAELSQGINVYSPLTGKPYGKSLVAANKAIRETAISRVFLPIPILVLSPVMMLGIERAFPRVARVPRLRIPVQAAVITNNFLLGLPISLSLFEQEGQVAVKDLELDIQKRLTMEGIDQPQYLSYNKGL